jgi:hypothetical protein
MANIAIFSDIVPCGPYISGGFGETYHIHLQGRKSVEKETSMLAGVRSARLNIPEDVNLHNYRCENLKSYKTCLYIKTDKIKDLTAVHATCVLRYICVSCLQVWGCCVLKCGMESCAGLPPQRGGSTNSPVPTTSPALITRYHHQSLCSRTALNI